MSGENMQQQGNGKSGEYYVGLDIGTGSVGWAATTPDYRLLRFNRKDMWGSRLFEEAKVASERRAFRIARRRTMRRKFRLGLLQELFAEAISSVDSDFFLRLAESPFHASDKKVPGVYSLFNDEGFTDADYAKAYPTIYHLRSALIHDEAAHDVRLLYLALHHMIKNRGHFLFGDQDLSGGPDFSGVYRELAAQAGEYMVGDEVEGSVFTDARMGQMERILTNSELTISDKKAQLNDLFAIGRKADWKELMSLIVGGKAQLYKLFGDDDYKDAQPKDIEFKKGNYDEVRDEYAALLADRIALIDAAKAVYDWMKLRQILGNHQYLSDAMVEMYDAHQQDLQDAKHLIKTYGAPGDMTKAFRSEEQGYYASYVGFTENGGSKKIIRKRAKQEDVNKHFEDLIAGYTNVSESDAPIKERLLARLKEKIAFGKMRNSDNGVIPYQVHKMEMAAMLKNAERHFPFLAQVDEDGMSVSDKVISILTFRIPYYVGPLNPAHAQEDGHAWVVRRRSGRVLPWNFEEMVDRKASAEKFIRRMTNQCSYLAGENVIPKDSLLYSRYMILNELNNVRVDGEPLEISLKKEIFDKLFKTNRNVSIAKFRNILKSNGYPDAEDAVITGIDGKFQANYKSYVEMKAIFGDVIDTPAGERMVEELILWKCLYGEDASIFKEKVQDEYSGKITAEQLKKVVAKKYSGWGRFSEKLLTGVEGVDGETGEQFASIMDALEHTQDNLMQLLSTKYTFGENIDKENAGLDTIEEVTFASVMKDTYLSAPVKRAVWQAILICEEIRKIRKAAPKKIFLEMTRDTMQSKQKNKGKRTVSRKQQLQKLYAACKEDVHALAASLEERTDAELRSKRLFLYYLQQGRCMYTGQKIDLDALLRKEHTYDIDHIYPRSLTKDDSWDNLALVTSKANRGKDGKNDEYPIKPNVQKEMKPFWQRLRHCGLLSEKKYNRLVRTEELTTEELAGFVSRQLVETSQIVKATADILKQIYPDTQLVYVRAGNVSDFRHKYELIKVRDLNNLHHAHDAYLNIIVGNAYDAKFTDNPFKYIKAQRDTGEKHPYNLYKLFDKEINNSRGITVWHPEMIGNIKHTLARRTVNVTRMPIEQTGALFKATILPKGQDAEKKTPTKTSDERLLDLSKYGSYDKASVAYFIVVEHTKGKKRIRTFEPVMLMYKTQAEKDMLAYCKTILGLVQPKIICKKIRMQSEIECDGYSLIMRSKSGSDIRCADAQELQIENIALLKKVTGDVSKKAAIGKSVKLDVSVTDLRVLYESILHELREGAFKDRPNNPIAKMESYQGNLDAVSTEEAQKDLLVGLIMAAVHLMSDTSMNGTDLRAIGGSKMSGITSFNKNISKRKMVLVNRSVTGLYINKKVLNQP